MTKQGGINDVVHYYFSLGVALAGTTPELNAKPIIVLAYTNAICYMKTL